MVILVLVTGRKVMADFLVLDGWNWRYIFSRNIYIFCKIDKQELCFDYHLNYGLNDGNHDFIIIIAVLLPVGVRLKFT